MPLSLLANPSKRAHPGQASNKLTELYRFYRLCLLRFDSKTHEYTVKAGETLEMEARVHGHPIPFIEWYFGEEKQSVTS